MENRRDIELADDTGKAFMTIARNTLMPHLHNSEIESQWGFGLNGSSCDVAHLLLQETVAAGNAEKLSAAIIFIDVKECICVGAQETRV